MCVGYFTPQAYCPLWGAKLARFCFSVPSMEVQDFHLRPRVLPCSHFGLTPLSHIDRRCAPLMVYWVYKPLEQPWVYHYHAATRQSPWPEVKILDFHTRGRETKPCGLGSPKRTMSLWGKIPHNTNIRFKAKNNNNMKVKKLKCWCGIEKAK